MLTLCWLPQEVTEEPKKEEEETKEVVKCEQCLVAGVCVLITVAKLNCWHHRVQIS